MVNNSPAARDVYARMRALIVTGRIAPGARLVETEVARSLAVSRTPIRAAMQRLAHEGLAYTIGTGAKTQMAVSPATLSDMVDLFDIIGSLEGLAGRSVVRLAPPARRRLAAELTSLNAAFAKLAQARRRDFDRFFAAHDAFHACLVDRCSSRRLLTLIDIVRPQVKRYELLYATAVGRDFTASLREHRAIIAAVRSGDPDNVEQALRRNWSFSAKRLSHALASGVLTALGDYRAEQV